LYQIISVIGRYRWTFVCHTYLPEGSLQGRSRPGGLNIQKYPSEVKGSLTHKSYEARSISYLALYSKHKRRSAPQCLYLYKITVRYMKGLEYLYLKLTSEISIWAYAIANSVRILSCATSDLFQILSKAIFIQDCM